MKLKLFLLFGIGLLGLMGVVGLSLFVGPVSISPHSLFQLDDVTRLVFFDIRLPRVVTAVVVGVALASAGCIFQGILQNPLADPYILGVSSGSALGVVLAILLEGTMMSHTGLFFSGVLGALATVLVLLGFSWFLSTVQVIHYILIGIMINTFFAAITMMAFFLFGQQLSWIMRWLMGDLTASRGWVLLGSGVLVLMGVLVAWILSYRLNILSLGDEAALSLGVSVSWMRLLYLVLGSVLTGVAVANAGVIGFVGLIVPHSIRLLIGDDFRILIPLSALYGAILLVSADAVSRVIWASSELPVGLLMSLIGVPFFLILLLRRLRGY